MDDYNWDKYAIHVLKELERIAKEQQDANKHLETIKSEITGLKVKSGTWGLIGGTFPMLISIVAQLIKSKH